MAVELRIFCRSVVGWVGLGLGLAACAPWGSAVWSDATLRSTEQLPDSTHFQPRPPAALYTTPTLGADRLAEDEPAEANAGQSLPPLHMPPTLAASTQTFSLAASRLPVVQVLMTLAQQGHFEVDIHEGTQATITLYAQSQPLAPLLERIAQLAEVRMVWRENTHGAVLTVSPDWPYWRSYSLDYVNMQRSSEGKMTIATSVAGESSRNMIGGSSGITIHNQAEHKFWERLEKNLKDMLRVTQPSPASRTRMAIEHGAAPQPARRTRSRSNPQGAQPTTLYGEPVDMPGKEGAPAEAEEGDGETGDEGAADEGSGAALSAIRLPHASLDREQALRTAQAVAPAGIGAPWLFAMLNGALHNDPLGPASSSRSRPRVISVQQPERVILHPETGVVSVYARARDQQVVAAYLARLTGNAHRQVMLEASLIEVELHEAYQTGIDWSLLQDSLNKVNLHFHTAASSNMLSSALIAQGHAAGGGMQSLMLQALETFGHSRVLSSPKVMALNNQAALLKVVEEKVYFTLALQNTQASAVAPAISNWSSRVNSIPVGMVLNVVPQISAHDQVTLNVHTVISRIIGYRADPLIDLVQPTRSSDPNAQNLVPETQVRELESTLRLASGETAILGGLIEERAAQQREGVPWLSRLPLLGWLFGARSEDRRKTELLIFMRPVVQATLSAAQQGRQN